MRVLQVHTRYRQGGGEDAVVDADAAALRGAGIEVVRYDASNPVAPIASARALVRSPWNRTAARDVRAALARSRPDVIHVHNTWFALGPAAVEALGAAAAPVVMTLHNYRVTCINSLLYRDGHPCEDCIGGSPFQGVAHRCYRGSALQSLPAAAAIAVARRRGTWDRSVDRFLALTDFARERLTRAGLPRDRIDVRANAVPDPGPRTCSPAQSPVVLFVGRLAPEKGLRVALEAWSQAHTDGLELHVLGDGPEGDALRAIAPPGVRFLGRLPVEEVRSRMLAARALLLPSTWYEGQPVTLVEALACGLPLRVSDLGGAGETVAALGPETLVAPGDVAAWARALSALVDEADLDAESRRARGRYVEAHTPQRSLATLLDTYRTVGAPT